MEIYDDFGSGCVTKVNFYNLEQTLYESRAFFRHVLRGGGGGLCRFGFLFHTCTMQGGGGVLCSDSFTTDVGS